MLNHITLMGRLTDAPVLRSVGAGVSCANFTLAVNRDFKNKDTGDYETDFIDITAWRGTADFVGKYFTKGQLVAVEGRLQIESYTDREGVRRRAARVQAGQVHFAEARKDNYAQGFNPPQQTAEPQNTGPAYGGGGGGAPSYTPPSAPSYASPAGYSIPNDGGGYSVPDAPQDNFRTLTPEEEKEDFPF
ncbi:MAG: single-stranded DNA-binding protein [Eubacteriales bacterium]